MEKIIRYLRLRRGRLIVISDTTVAALYAKEFAEQLGAVLLTIAPGEASKCRAVKEELENALIDLGVSRKDTLVAFGGGVVSDVVGFVAATYLRGLNYIAIPTTLMGMVDAAIGSKNGINHPKGKNLLGSLHAPEEVFIEPKFLETLPKEVFQEGFIEVIKYGLIWDESVIGSNDYIDRCIAIKREVVRRDPMDIGFRRILNYGHLVAHAIEKCTHYAVSHGRAVWFGLLVESLISHERGYLTAVEWERIQKILLQHHFAKVPELSAETVYEAMRSDKKADSGMPRVVLLKRIGKVVSFGGEYCTPLPYDEFAKAFSSVRHLTEKPALIRSLTA